MRVTPYGSVTIASLSGCVVNGQPITEPWIAYGFETGSCSQRSDTPGIVFNTPTGYSNASGGQFFPGSADKQRNCQRELQSQLDR